MARHADIWHSFGEPETFARKSSVLDQWCASEGRDPAEIERSLAVQGGPDDNAQRLSDLGVRLFTVRLGGPRYDLGQLTGWLAFRDEANRGTVDG